MSLEEAQAVLAALVLLVGEWKAKAAYALAELLSRRGLERFCEDTCGVGARGVELGRGMAAARPHDRFGFVFA